MAGNSNWQLMLERARGNTALGRQEAAQPSPAEAAAKDAGFSSAAEQQANRQMRNQLEMKAQMLNVPVADAYALVPGGDLTDTAAIQEAWNSLTFQPAEPPPAPPPPPQVDPKTRDEPSYSDQAAAILDQARGMVEQMALQQQQSEQARRLQDQRDAELRNRLAIQSAANTSRGQMQASLKISPSSQTSSTGGTSAFKRRGDTLSVLPIQKTVGLNVPTSNRLNV